MKVFVTGASGFVGRALTARLASSDHRCFFLNRTMDLPNIEHMERNHPLWRWLQGELPLSRHFEAVISDKRPDAAIHLAWEGIPDFSTELCIKNLSQSLRLFNVLGRAGCKKLIVLGTCAEYGFTDGVASEDMDMRPELAADSHSFKNNLGVYKNALHILARQIASEHKMQLIWVRPFYIYGQGQRIGSLIPSLISAIRRGEEVSLKTPDVAHDFVHVSEVADVLCMLLDHQSAIPHSVYNVGTGELVSVRSVAQRIYALVGQNGWQEKSEALGKDPDRLIGLRADVRKISNDIGWKPAIMFAYGLHSTFLSFT